MASPKILVQLDPDSQASLFDAVVAVDSDVDHLLQYRQVEPAQVRDLVHGAIFTRGPKDLIHTAIFVGGSDVDRGERLLEQVLDSFLGPLRVSVLLDANGANTTSAAAVLAAEQHVALAGCTATVLAATGPVGQRVARLLVQEGANVRIASRSVERATAVCDRLAQLEAPGSLTPVVTNDERSTAAALEGVQLCIAAGAAGIRLLPAAILDASNLNVAIDLNAVPPLGIEGVEVTDKAEVRGDCACYGAVGIGGTKMKIHKAAIKKLFTANDLVLDVDEVFALGRELGTN
jgi:hypothetical protein